jgi:hypothetical protein
MDKRVWITIIVIILAIAHYFVAFNNQQIAHYEFPAAPQAQAGSNPVAFYVGGLIKKEFRCNSQCVYDCGNENTQTLNVEWYSCSYTSQGAANGARDACIDAQPNGCTNSIWGFGGITCSIISNCDTPQ